MDRKIFLDWYKKNFIPFVKAHQKTPAKVLLLLDCCPAHSPADVLNAIDPQFQVLYLPPNVTSLKQPMNPGVIEITEKLYRTKLLTQITAVTEEVNNPEVFLKNFNITNACDLIVSARQELTQENLASA